VGSDLREKIKYLKEVERLSFSQISERVQKSKSTCQRIYSNAPCPSKPRESSLNQYKELIRSWYAEHPSLKAKQVWQRLISRNVKIGYTQVKRFTRQYRHRSSRKSYYDLEFLPGEEAQVDWFFINHPKLGKLSGFALILSFSRWSFAHLFFRHTFEFFIEGHLKAFEQIKGLPHTLVYDNLRSVVLKREPLTFNPAFLDFASHYGFKIRLCNVGKGNEKGRVERLIRSMRETSGNENSLGALNSALNQWIKEKNEALHRSTGHTPKELFLKENLKALPIHPFNNYILVPNKSSTKTALVKYNNNFYSIPEYLTGQPLTLYVYVDRIEIFDAKNRKIASHQRSFKVNQKISNPLHRKYKISEQAKKERIFHVIKNMDPCVQTFLLQNEQTGESSYESTQILFEKLKSFSRYTILSAIREALKRKIPRIKFVTSLLEAQLNVNPQESVCPQDPSLLDISFNPRPLEEYQND
jgi:transposase